jgi:hypothetical protein
MEEVHVKNNKSVLLLFHSSCRLNQTFELENNCIHCLNDNNKQGKEYVLYSY